MRKAVVVLAAAAVMLCASVVWGQVGNGGGGRRGGAGGERQGGGGMMASPATVVMVPQNSALETVATALGLTDSQKAALKDILAKSEEANISIVRKAAEATRKLRAALFASDFSAENVAKLMVDARNAEAIVIDARIATWTKIRAIPLTEEQLAKLRRGAVNLRGRGGMRPGGPRSESEAPPPPSGG